MMLRYIPLITLLFSLMCCPASVSARDAEREDSSGKEESASGDSYIVRCGPRNSNGTQISSEYLQGVLMFEIGELDWGDPSRTQNGTLPRNDQDAGSLLP